MNGDLTICTNGRYGKFKEIFPNNNQEDIERQTTGIIPDNNKEIVVSVISNNKHIEHDKKLDKIENPFKSKKAKISNRVKERSKLEEILNKQEKTSYNINK